MVARDVTEFANFVAGHQTGRGCGLEVDGLGSFGKVDGLRVGAKGERSVDYAAIADVQNDVGGVVLLKS